MSEYIDKEQFREALIGYSCKFNDDRTIQVPSKIHDYLRGLGNLLNRYPTADVQEMSCKGCNNRMEEMCRECCRWYMDMYEKEEE